MDIAAFGNNLEKNRRILVGAEKLAVLRGWEWEVVNDCWTMALQASS
jgi:hypothetical protein